MKKKCTFEYATAYSLEQREVFLQITLNMNYSL